MYVYPGENRVGFELRKTRTVARLLCAMSTLFLLSRKVQGLYVKFELLASIYITSCQIEKFFTHILVYKLNAAINWRRDYLYARMLPHDQRHPTRLAIRLLVHRDHQRVVMQSTTRSARRTVLVGIVVRRMMMMAVAAGARRRFGVQKVGDFLLFPANLFKFI